MLHLARWVYRSHDFESSEFESLPEAVQQKEFSSKDGSSPFFTLSHPIQTNFHHGSAWLFYSETTMGYDLSRPHEGGTT